MTSFHGGDGDDFIGRHYPAAPTPWLDLSTGINPWPYPADTVTRDAWSRLPTAALEHACGAAAARYFETPAEHVVLTPGSQAAIVTLPTLFPPTDVAVVEPTYSEHAAAWRRAGHTLRAIAARDAADAAEAMLVLTSPNNPDGHVVSVDALRDIARHRTARDKWLIVDGAFADLEPAAAIGDFQRLKLAHLRSFGKFFGLAGVRLGAVLAPPGIAAALRDRLGAWAVSGPALAIGARAYADAEWQGATRARLAAAARSLRKLLRDAGLRLLGGTDLFQLAAHERAPSLFAHLAENGVYVRRFDRDSSWLRFGLPPDGSASERLSSLLSAWTSRR